MLRNVEAAVALGRSADAKVRQAVEGKRGIEALGRISSVLIKEKNKGAKKGAAAWAKLVEACETCGTAIASVTELSASLLLGVLQFALSVGRVSSGGLGSLLSSIRTHAAVIGTRWAVDPAEYSYIRRTVIPELEKMWPHEVKRKKAITPAVLEQLLLHLRTWKAGADKDPWSVQMAAVLTAGFSGLMRSIDYANPKAPLRTDQLGVVDVPDDEDPDGGSTVALAVDLPFRKNKKGERDENADIVTLPQIVSAREAMERHLALSGRRIGEGDSNVFRRISRREGGKVLGQVYSRAQALKDFRWLLVKAAVCKDDGAAREYGLHSLRSGGATAMLVAKVPWDVVKKLGCWRVDGSMQLYDRRGAELAAEVARQWRSKHKKTRQ